MAYRTGDKNAFWDNAAVGAAGLSNIVEIGRGVENIAIFVTASGATTITVLAAHSGDITSQGILPDDSPAGFGAVKYIVDPLTITFAAAGSQVLLVPDVPFAFIQLQSSAAATITAGWMGSGER